MTTTSALTRPIGVGIVGASATRGWAAAAHIPALRAFDDYEIRAVSTTRLETASATAQRLGVALAYDNHEQLVSRPEVDLVVVTVKVPAHHRIVADALSAGKMVYCEWPLTRNLAEAEDLAARARASTRPTMVGLQGGMHPPIRFVHDLIRQGAIGTPLSTSIRARPNEEMWQGRFDPPFEFMADSSQGATMLSIAAGHALEPLAHVLGEFSSISAVVANRRGDGVRLRDGSKLPNDAPDEIAATGVLDNGVVASLHYSAGYSAGPPMAWDIQGSEGSLLIESAVAGYLQFGDLDITLRRGQANPQRLAVPPTYFAGVPGLSGAAAGVGRMYVRFAEDLRRGTRTVPDFDAALARHRVLDAIASSASTGQRIDLHRA